MAQTMTQDEKNVELVDLRERITSLRQFLRGRRFASNGEAFKNLEGLKVRRDWLMGNRWPQSNTFYNSYNLF